jgi:ABC-type phosphate transport system substrate-binding protein
MKKQQPNGFMLRSALALILAAAASPWLFVPIHTVQAAGDPIVVIVNVANPVENLSVSELKKIFLSDRSKWDTGKSVAPVMIVAGNPERTAFLKIVCGMSDADFSKYFLQAAFTGKSATPPKEVGSGHDVKSIVAGSPGAIGFVKASDFHGDGSDGGIKAVKIDAAAASDPDYKLRM